MGFLAALTGLDVRMNAPRREDQLVLGRVNPDLEGRGGGGCRRVGTHVLGLQPRGRESQANDDERSKSLHVYSCRSVVGGAASNRRSRQPAGGTTEPAGKNHPTACRVPDRALYPQ